MKQRQETRYKATVDEIKSVAWARIADQGVAGLSLRGIAADMGLSAPALYRYFACKNDLVTALVIDAFTTLARVQQDLLTGSAGKNWQDRLTILGQGFREWALGNQAAFFLVFGSPLPGYEPPWHQTMPVAADSQTALMTVLEEGVQSRDIVLPLTVAATPALAESLESWNSMFHRRNPEILYLAFTITARVQGLLMVELGRQLPPFFTDGRDLYQRELERIIADLVG